MYRFRRADVLKLRFSAVSRPFWLAFVRREPEAVGESACSDEALGRERESRGEDGDEVSGLRADGVDGLEEIV